MKFVFIVNFEHISYIFIVFLLLTLNRVNVNWVLYKILHYAVVLSLLNRVSCVPACQRDLHANVLVCQRGLRDCVPTCQKCANFSFLRGNVPINVLTCYKACQFINLVCQRAKERADFPNILLAKC